MKFSKIFRIWAIFFAILHAKSHIISPILPAKNLVIDLNPFACDEKCLQKTYENGEFFSYVAKFDAKITDQNLRANLAEISKNYDIELDPEIFKKSQKIIKIALLAPKKIIGRYVNTGVSSILAYLLSTRSNFIFEVFDMGEESAENLTAAYEKIIAGGFSFVVALLTQNSAQMLVDSVKIALPTFVPTVNKNQISKIFLPENVFFGGINYEKQLEILKRLVKTHEILRLDDDSSVGESLAKSSDAQNFNTIFSAKISIQDAAQFSKKIDKFLPFLSVPDPKNEHIPPALLLNTPVIKTGLILSQISHIKRAPSVILSTQINFNPNILLLTKPRDRKNFYIINAIGNSDFRVLEYGLILGADLRFDWVSYAIAVSMEGLYQKHDDKSIKFFSEVLEDQQIIYKNKIYKIVDNNFTQIF